jgi:hypothetical protein
MSIRELYQREARSELAELTAQIELLRRRSAKAGSGAVSDHEERLVSLETRTKSIEVHLEALEDTEQDDWEGIQTDLRRSLEELSEEVAVEALAWHKMLGHSKPLMKGLRRAYLHRANTQLEELASEIESFADRASGVPMRSPSHLHQRVEDLRQLRESTHERLQGLAQETRYEWEEVTREIEQNIGSLRRELAEAECELNSTLVHNYDYREKGA